MKFKKEMRNGELGVIGIQLMMKALYMDEII